MSQPIYRQSVAFGQDVPELEKDPLPVREKEILETVKLSALIYKTQSHSLWDATHAALTHGGL